MILTVVDKHAPLVTKKLTVASALWLKGIETNDLECKRDHWWHHSHKKQINKNWLHFRDVRN